MNSSDFSNCKIEDLKFEPLSEEDQNTLNAYAKRSASQIVWTVIAVVFAAALLIWAWLLSHNGIGYSIAVSVLSLLVLGGAGVIGRKHNNKAQGAIHGVVETSFYQSAKVGSACDAVDYFATVAFPSSEQRMVNMEVPGLYASRGGLVKEGTELIIYKLSDNSCVIVYPEHASEQESFAYKLPRA